MSAPAAKYSSCIRRMTSGRVKTRFSLQPSRSAPAEVVGGQVLALEPRPGGAVEHEDPLGEDLLQSLGPLPLRRRRRGADFSHGTRIMGDSARTVRLESPRDPGPAGAIRAAPDGIPDSRVASAADCYWYHPTTSTMTWTELPAAWSSRIATPPPGAQRGRGVVGARLTLRPIDRRHERPRAPAGIDAQIASRRAAGDGDIDRHRLGFRRHPAQTRPSGRRPDRVRFLPVAAVHRGPAGLRMSRTRQGLATV